MVYAPAGPRCGTVEQNRLPRPLDPLPHHRFHVKITAPLDVLCSPARILLRPHSVTLLVRRAFTLIELLVVIAVVAVLVGLLLPALRSSRAAARTVVCQSQQGQIALLCLSYADDYKGKSPALGRPYRELPNWSVVVQAATGRAGSTGAELLSPNSILVCPAAKSALGGSMTRTYGINVTGHAGRPATATNPADPDNFDDASMTSHINVARITLPSRACLLLDTSVPPVGPEQPPATSTSSVLDFRNSAHNPARIGLVHGTRNRFNAAMFDGSSSTYIAPPPEWARPLP